jgi:hypothetical protein
LISTAHETTRAASAALRFYKHEDMENFQRIRARNQHAGVESPFLVFLSMNALTIVDVFTR